MRLKIKINDEDTQKVWNAALRAKKEVDDWPAWKRGDGKGVSMKLNVKLLRYEATLPVYATDGAAAMDLYAASGTAIKPGERWLCPTGIAMEIPRFYEGQVRPRSGLAVRHGVTVLNSPGTIDSDYRGEVCVPLINHGKETVVISIGDRVAQMVIAPVAKVEITEVEELSETARGEGGFGSRGR